MGIELAGYRIEGAVRVAGDGSGTSGGPSAPEPGGPAAVYSGVRLSDGLPVALKVFHPSDADRAAREAALTAAVDHPHVVPVLEVVAGPAAVALVLPLARGGDLAALVRARLRLPWAEALTVLIPLADALAAAHERGIVHGDLSAGNVLFDVDGRPLLADLGAARAAAELGGPVAATPGDAAPEIARGAAPSPEADLFSLGSVALRCLTGAPAWPADDLQDVLIQSAAGQWPDPGDLLGPPELVTIVRRLLDPEPGRRGSAARAAVELRRVGEPEPVGLVTTGEDGTVTGPAPATQVREDAARPPATSGGRVRRRGRLRLPAGGRGRAHRPLDHRPSAHRPGPSGGRRGPAHRTGPTGEDRRAGRRRWWQVTLAVAVGVLLVGGAVRAGLWWAGWGASDPVSVAAAPLADSATSGAHTPTDGAASPVAPPSRAGAPVGSDGSDPDWRTVVASLDAARSAALTSLDPALLDGVYTASAPARAADARRISQMAGAGNHVDSAAHRVTSVTLVGLGTGGSVQVRVVETQPSYPVRNAAGAVVGATSAASSTVVMQLVPTDGGFRISRIQRG